MEGARHDAQVSPRARRRADYREAETPLWEGMLNDGDMLYIPRGWWHVATPLDEPTLHLTVGVNNPTGADLLSWFVDRLRASEDVRRDLPLFGRAEDQTALMDRLRELSFRSGSPNCCISILRTRMPRASRGRA